ncbi:MAG: thymidylate kinase [Clostridiales bacterium]|jgi:dTMP kinase|nr:thymidylate kinase [Clostridiales bacterium]
MSTATFYGAGFPYRNFEKLPGKLIVLEGADGVGRSTQIRLLRHWLEGEGYAVSDTGLTRSELTAAGLEAAKSGHTLGPITMSLFYLADFADRIENQIIPALQAGFVVLSDRYFYSVIARDSIRGIDKTWARQLYGIALKPDLILYMKAAVPTLVSRLIHGRGLNYWEAGMDLNLADNMYDSFVAYQTSLMREFDELAREYNFVTVDADQGPELIFEELRAPILSLLHNRLVKAMRPL